MSEHESPRERAKRLGVSLNSVYQEIQRQREVEGRVPEYSEYQQLQQQIAREGRLLTAKDLSKRWTVSEAFVYRLAREGQIPHVKIGRYRRFRAADIESWEQQDNEPK